ncbi:DUF4113 domain-containing protein [Fluviibacter phosphoraccumulans]|uniref:DUF4113 domain-containing protein n=1 Tax=Fluviibacter phosphoraccumulans TaxID=1751046 RepID=UPI003D6B0DB5
MSRRGRGSVRALATGLDASWRMRGEKLSPASTTRWDALLRVTGGLKCPIETLQAGCPSLTPKRGDQSRPKPLKPSQHAVAG